MYVQESAASSVLQTLRRQSSEVDQGGDASVSPTLGDAGDDNGTEGGGAGQGHGQGPGRLERVFTNSPSLDPSTGAGPSLLQIAHVQSEPALGVTRRDSSDPR
jgi:hypothetical protein